MQGKRETRSPSRRTHRLSMNPRWCVREMSKPVFLASRNMRQSQSHTQCGLKGLFVVNMLVMRSSSSGACTTTWRRMAWAFSHHSCSRSLPVFGPGSAIAHGTGISAFVRDASMPTSTSHRPSYPSDRGAWRSPGTPGRGFGTTASISAFPSTALHARRSSHTQGQGLPKSPPPSQNAARRYAWDVMGMQNHIDERWGESMGVDDNTQRVAKLV